jgi:hypothetical protein
MEVKINREIRDYTESMFFGLSLRQFVFSLLAIFVAVGLYFILKPHLGTETVSWVCVLGAAPFAAMGFIKYNGMTAERFLQAWIYSSFIIPKKLMFRATNIYYEALKPIRGPRVACRVGRGGATERMSLAAGGEANIAKSATTIEGGKRK